MAFLAIPPIVAGVDWLLVALGVTAVGAGAVVVSEEVRRRQEAATRAGSGTAAQTSTETRRRSCDKCPPDCGTLVERNWNMSAAAREYQARMTGYAPGTEWNFGGIDFDGFASAQCMLKEAKSRYDQFITEGADAELEPRRWYRSFETKMLPQAERQARVAAAAAPAGLTWYFQGTLTYQYMARQVMIFPPLVAVHVP